MLRLSPRSVPATVPASLESGGGNSQTSPSTHPCLGEIKININEKVPDFLQSFIKKDDKGHQMVGLPSGLTCDDIRRDADFWNNHLGVLVAFYSNELIESVINSSSNINTDELRERFNQVTLDSAICDSTYSPIGDANARVVNGAELHQLIDLRIEKVADEIKKEPVDGRPSGNTKIDFNNTELTERLMQAVRNVTLSERPLSVPKIWSDIHVKKCQDVLEQTDSPDILKPKNVFEHLDIDESTERFELKTPKIMAKNGQCLFLSIHDQLKRINCIDDTSVLNVVEEKAAIARYINNKYVKDSTCISEKSDMIYQLLEENDTWYATGENGLFGQSKTKRDDCAEDISQWILKYYLEQFKCPIVVLDGTNMITYNDGGHVEFVNTTSFFNQLNSSASIDATETKNKKEGLLNSVVIIKDGAHYNSAQF
jgi:hypothetical protein